jgi:hypothetical protein
MYTNRKGQYFMHQVPKSILFSFLYSIYFSEWVVPTLKTLQMTMIKSCETEKSTLN